MKKLLSVLIVLILCIGAACAETTVQSRDIEA